jgi:hypothetical protein
MYSEVFWNDNDKPDDIDWLLAFPFYYQHKNQRQIKHERLKLEIKDFENLTTFFFVQF